MLLLNDHELAVGEPTPGKVKVIDLKQPGQYRYFDDATGLKPRFLDLTPDNQVLVGFAKNQLFMYSRDGKLQKTLTAPHIYGCAGLTHQSDGTIIIGTDGAGWLYTFDATGTLNSTEQFASPPDVGNTTSLLGLADDSILFGAQNFVNDGKLMRLDKFGNVNFTQEFPLPNSVTFRSLRRFSQGFLFVDYLDYRVYRLNDNLAVETAPFATLSNGSFLSSLVWLDKPPPQ
jgi:hypothetical protein